MDVKTLILNILSGLVPLSKLPSFAWDLVPKQVYALIATIAVHASAFIETHIAELVPALGPDAKPVVFLTEVKADLDAALPAGSEVLKTAVPKILAAIQAYIVPTGASASPITKALTIHIATVDAQAAVEVAQKQLQDAQASASQQIGVDLTDSIPSVFGADQTDANV